MPKFFVTHPPNFPPAPATVEELTPLCKKVKANCTLDAYWVRSIMLCDEEGKIVRALCCEWDAVDAESIRKVLAKVPEVPVEGIYPAMVVDSDVFR